MRSSIIHRIVAAALVMATAGCGSSSTPRNPSPTPTPPTTPAAATCPALYDKVGFVRATIDGVPWTSDCVNATRSGVFSIAGTTFPSRGLSALLSLVIILGPPPGGPGTFGLNDNLNASVQTATSTVTAYTSLLGGTAPFNLTITSLTASGVSGTFAFVAAFSAPNAPASAPKVVTNGSFNVTF